MIIAATQAEAEQKLLHEAPQMRVLRSREINLDGIAAMLNRSLDKHWAVVFAHRDHGENDEPGQGPSPEDVLEREWQVRYLQLAVDPMRAATGTIDQFPCPACGETVRLQLPVPTRSPKALNRQCPHCRTPLTRPAKSLAWEILPPNSTQPVPCIFCGVIDDSHEHAIPKWISERLGLRTMLRVEDALIHPGPARRRHPISFASHTTRGFCHGCNKHFGLLEDEVAPTLEAMARGRDLTLNAAMQQKLALWANKTAFALRTAENKLDLPFAQDQLQAVRQGMVAPRTWVGFFSWRGEPVLATGTGRLTTGAGAQHLYLAMLTFANVGFCVTAVTQPLVGNQRISADVNNPVAQLWPERYPTLSWPWPPVDNRIVPRLLELVPLTAV
jgi:hypothetical protein